MQHRARAIRRVFLHGLPEMPRAVFAAVRAAADDAAAGKDHTATMKRATILLFLVLAPLALGQDKKADEPGLITDGPSNAHIFTPYEGPTIVLGGDQIIEIKNSKGELIVRADPQGKITYGGNYKPDEAARTFWEVLTRSYSEVCAQTKKEPEKK